VETQIAFQHADPRTGSRREAIFLWEWWGKNSPTGRGREIPDVTMENAAPEPEAGGRLPLKKIKPIRGFGEKGQTAFGVSREALCTPTRAQSLGKRRKGGPPCTGTTRWGGGLLNGARKGREWGGGRRFPRLS